MASQTQRSGNNAANTIVVPAPRNANRRLELTISITWSATPTSAPLLTVVNTDGETEIERYYSGATERAGAVGKAIKPETGATITAAAPGNGIFTTLTVDWREIPAPARPREEMDRI